MAKITRIKATDPRDKKPKEVNLAGSPPTPIDELELEEDFEAEDELEDVEETPTFSEREARAHKKAAEKERRAVKKAERRKEKIEDKEAQGKKGFGHILTAPFRYLRDSWREIRQVRWPNRKATWKMVLAIFVYAALFVALIMLLDVFFTWLFNLILK